jgi:hypothetical protein
MAADAGAAAAGAAALHGGGGAAEETDPVKREEARRKAAELTAARNALAARIPTDQYFELPGRPTVVFQVRQQTCTLFNVLSIQQSANSLVLPMQVS